jgi:hypothetical protein
VGECSFGDNRQTWNGSWDAQGFADEIRTVEEDVGEVSPLPQRNRYLENECRPSSEKTAQVQYYAVNIYQCSGHRQTICAGHEIIILFFAAETKANQTNDKINLRIMFLIGT